MFHLPLNNDDDPSWDVISETEKYTSESYDNEHSVSGKKYSEKLNKLRAIDFHRSLKNAENCPSGKLNFHNAYLM